MISSYMYELHIAVLNIHNNILQPSTYAQASE